MHGVVKDTPHRLYSLSKFTVSSAKSQFGVEPPDFRRAIILICKYGAAILPIAGRFLTDSGHCVVPRWGLGTAITGGNSAEMGREFYVASIGRFRTGALQTE